MQMYLEQHRPEKKSLLFLRAGSGAGSVQGVDCDPLLWPDRGKRTLCQDQFRDRGYCAAACDGHMPSKRKTGLCRAALPARSAAAMIGQGGSGSNIAEEDDLWFLPDPAEEDDLPLEYLLYQRPRRGEIKPRKSFKGRTSFSAGSKRTSTASSRNTSRRVSILCSMSPGPDRQMPVSVCEVFLA